MINAEEEKKREKDIHRNGMSGDSRWKNGKRETKVAKENEKQERSKDEEIEKLKEKWNGTREEK